MVLSRVEKRWIRDSGRTFIEKFKLLDDLAVTIKT